MPAPGGSRPEQPRQRPQPARPYRPPPGQRRPRPLLRAMLGAVLRGTRLAQHRTLADVARAARVSVPYLSELERGRKEASSEVLAAVCDALGLGLPGLLAEAGRLAGPGLAGAGREPAGDRAGSATVVRLGDARDRLARRPEPPARGSGDARCLLAA